MNESPDFAARRGKAGRVRIGFPGSVCTFSDGPEVCLSFESIMFRNSRVPPRLMRSINENSICLNSLGDTVVNESRDATNLRQLMMILGHDELVRSCHHPFL